MLLLALQASLVSVHAQTGPPQGRLVSWNNFSTRVTANTFDFIAVSAGINHSLALRADGSLYSWGSDGLGQVSGTPAGNNFIAISAGGGHSLALRADHTIVAWGFDSSGQVSQTPTGNHFIAIAAGEAHNVALRDDGSLVAWGNDADGQVSQTPTTGTYTAISAGTFHNVAIRTDGSLVAWGNSLGHNLLDVPSGNNFVAIAAGFFQSLALRSDGTIVCWGDDSVGQITNTPTDAGYVAIASGLEQNIALRADGSLVTWGRAENSSTATPPLPGTDFLAIAANGDYFSAIRRTNHAPVVQGADLTIEEHNGIPGGQFSLPNEYNLTSDDDADTLQYAWTENGTVLRQGVAGQDPPLALSRPPGTYTFTLTATDPFGASNSNEVHVLVKPDPNQAPVAAPGSDRSFTLPHDGDPNTGDYFYLFNFDDPSSPYWDNSYDPDGDGISEVLTDENGMPVDYGDPVYLTAGTYTYTLTVTDPYGLSNSATFKVNVTEPNQAPTANAQSLSLNQATSLGITLTGSDPDGDSIVYAVASNPAHGTLSGTAPNLTYKPNASYSGSDSFTFRVTDSYGASSTATVSINVVPVPKIEVKLTAIGQLLQVVGVVVTVRNSSTAAVSNIKINSSSLIGINASLIVPNGFSLGAGKSADVGIVFFPLKKGQKGTLSLTGSSTGGTFSFSQAVTIP